MSNERGEIHVGDIGTVYRVPTYDDDLTPANFDPSGAATKRIYFSMPKPDGTFATLQRDATAFQRTINGVQVWCLEYEVVSADAATFHIAAGKLQLQGYVEYVDGRKWRSSKITSDQKGRPLQVAANL